MALLTSIAGYASFGMAARGITLSIQRRPIASGFGGYAISAVVFGGVGYFMHNLEQRQNELLKERKEVLAANRERRFAAQGFTA
ncbi:hypothetical protein BGZ51_002005 [Haplosporangium sp. Z 767]|nr:hypothetical protein BGZ51_002005 [Haplosporangium sp. Z 767]KAF9187457.1 hypothetical protein BGZ50_001927 [Haplosporangium sp. Z 11]